jgi:hypothetical protein
MKQASWILTFALVSLQAATALADQTLEQYQQQCTAAVKAHDDGATIAACQRAALDYALYAARQVGEGRYTMLLQEGSDILDPGAHPLRRNRQVLTQRGDDRSSPGRRRRRRSAPRRARDQATVEGAR